MKGFIGFLVLVAITVSAAFAQTYNPDLDLLKPNRTYFGISELEPLRHHFVVTFLDVEPHQLGMGVDSIDEIEKLGNKDFVGGWGLVPGHNASKPVPESLKGFEERLIARIKKMHPKATDIRVSYNGRYRKVRVVEIIPQDFLGSKATDRTAIKSWLSYRYDPEKNLIEPDFSIGFDAMMGGFTALASRGARRSNEAELNLRWLPIVLSPSIDGHSLVIEYGSTQDAIRLEYQRFLEVLKKSIDRIDSGLYGNPIREVVSRQGETIFPSGYRGFAVIRGDLYARAGQFENQRHFPLHFEIPVMSALNGNVAEGSFETPELNLRTVWRIDLESKDFSIKFYRMKDGNAQLLTEAKYEVKAEIVRDGTQARVHFGSLEITGEVDNQINGVSLPGVHHFTALDIYFRHIVPVLQPRLQDEKLLPFPVVPDVAPSAKDQKVSALLTRSEDREAGFKSWCRRWIKGLFGSAS